MRSAQELVKAGFTVSGAKRFEAASKGYIDELFNKSVAFGDRDKASDAPREVTHDHVRAAAEVLTSQSANTPKRSHIFMQLGEYIGAALAGVGGSALDKTWGILVFALSLTAGVVLFVIRNTGGRRP